MCAAPLGQAKQKDDGEGEEREGGGEGSGGGGFFSFLGVWDSPPAATGADGDAPGDGVGSDSGSERRLPAAAAASFSTATEDFAIIPGGFIGAEAMLSGQTTSRHYYLAMKETTLLKVGRKMFDRCVPMLVVSCCHEMAASHSHTYSVSFLCSATSLPRYVRCSKTTSRCGQKCGKKSEKRPKNES
jgi:hypothetical protein